MPERTPLNARVVGSFERPGYRLEKVVYESRPGVIVSANLYVPRAAKPPLPGVLFQMGHALNGKAAEPYQRCCQGLAQLGYLVLAFDPMGQGERIHYLDASGARTRLGSADDEHTVPGRQMLLIGDTATRWQVWDAVRSLDLLASHPLVDPRRLASTGQSGGGTLTMLLACVDDRLAAAAVASGNTENFACRNFDPPGSTDDAEQNLIASAPVGLDRWDLLYPLAPKPLLVSVSEKDFFGTYSSNYLSSGLEEFEKLKRVYEILGAADQLAWTSTPLPHALAYDTRLKIYHWFNRWLKGENRPVDREPPTQPELDQQLWVSSTGSVVRDFASKTPFEITRDAARSLPRRRPTRSDLSRLLALDRAPTPTQFRVLGKALLDGLDIEAVEVASAPHVWVPAWLFVPHNHS
ncbi:MAG: alpha/beta hydrolase family protein, partial [Bryobacteraceae bacterium]